MLTCARHARAVKVTFKLGEREAVRFYDWTPGLEGFTIDDVMAKVKSDHDLLIQLGAEKQILAVGGAFDDAHNFIPEQET